MSKEIYISSTPHETRLAIVENDELAEIYYERENEYTLAGSIYNGRVTRVLPGMQSAFVEIGLERDAFLYITDFLEETEDEDATDIDAAAAVGGERARPDENGRGRGGDRDRGGRGGRDRGGDRGDRGERGERPERPRAAAEPSDAELFRSAVEGLEKPRVIEGERSSERGRRPESGRVPEIAASAGAIGIPEGGADEIGEGQPGAEGSRRWRGRRGRRGRGGRSGVQEMAREQAAGGAPETVAEPEFVEPRFEEQESEPMELEAAMETLPTEAEQSAFRERTAESQERASGSQERVAGSPERMAEVREPQQRADAGRGLERGGRGGDRGGRDRGGRDRGGDRGPDRGERGGDRGGRDAGRSERGPQRVPRGFAPAAERYGAPGGYGEETLPEAPVEPIILPGESLSKYRAGGNEPAANEGKAAATPAVDTFVAEGWDGGMVLPGETLRRRESPPALRNDSPRGGAGRRDSFGQESSGQESSGQESSRREGGPDRGGRDRGGRGGDRERGRGRDRDRGGDRSGDRGRFGRAQESVPARTASGEETEVVSAVGVPAELVPMPEPLVPEHTVAPETYAADTAVPVESPDAQHAEIETAVQPAPMEEEAATYLSDPAHVPSSHLVTPLNTTFVPPPPVPAETAPAVAQAEQEYEPTEASASYRVDPVPPSEFRVPSPTVEEPETLEPAPVEAATATKFDTGSDVFPSHMAEQSAQAHDVTSISETGEMLSEPPAAAAEHELQGQEPAEPVAHAETQSADTVAGTPAQVQPVLEAREFVEPLHEEPTLDETPEEEESLEGGRHLFEPGQGFLEEEMMDEEDDGGSLESLQASRASIEQEFAEGEMVESGADFGSLVRDLSIEQMTRPSPVLDEEDEDFEGDFVEEDQEFGSATFEEEEEGELEEERGLDEPAGESVDGERAAHATGAEGSAQPGERVRREGGRRRGRRGGERRSSENDGAERSGLDRPASDRAASDRAASDRPGLDRAGADRLGAGSERPASDRPERGGYERSERADRPDRSERSDRDRGERSDRGDRGGRREGGGGHRSSRMSMQSTNLPAISDLLKPGQEILVQIAKEPIAKKGARITSHIALPGRFLVFMPTVSHTGVSRKIESDGERRRLKEILLSERGDAQGGFIVRTAAAGASEEELRSDLRFLLNLWSDIKARSESSKSPALIYHDLNLIERVLRDQVTDTFSAIWVDTETEYERVLRFLQRFQPSLIRRVKLYTKETPLFEQFGITEEINKALRSKVWLKSGGSIVINQTEALVAIDINTGKYVGKTARLEDTIVKTNLDAIPEIVRQIRLRDLGGIIIIDFIDMDERKNRNRVMAALEEELKNDRAPSKVLQFNDFGLVAITRKRVKQSLERTLSTTCGVCQGTGMVKSPVTVCNDIYIEMRKMAKHLDRGDVMLRVNPEVVKQLKAPGTHWLQEMEEMVGKTILVKSDPALHPEQFDIH